MYKVYDDGKNLWASISESSYIKVACTHQCNRHSYVKYEYDMQNIIQLNLKAHIETLYLAP